MATETPGFPSDDSSSSGVLPFDVPGGFDDPKKYNFNQEEGLERSLVRPSDIAKAIPDEDKPHLDAEEGTGYWLEKGYSIALIYSSEKDRETKYCVVTPHLADLEQVLLAYIEERLFEEMEYDEMDLNMGRKDRQRRIQQTFFTLIKRQNLTTTDRIKGTQNYFQVDEDPDESEVLEGGVATRMFRGLAGLFSRRKLDSAAEEKGVESVDTSKFNDIEHMIDSGGDFTANEVEDDIRALAPLSEHQIDKMLYYLIRKRTGYGKIEPLLEDDNIEDISVDGYHKNAWVYHQSYTDLKTNVEFHENDLDELINFIAEADGKGISKRQPQVNATLEDGSRAQLTLSDELSVFGSNLTIRVFKDVPFTPVDLIHWKTYNIEQMAFLWLATQFNSHMIFAGATASGKTTTLNACSLFIPTAKIVSIEDTAELTLPQEHWVKETTREHAGVGNVQNYEMMDLLEAALRQRPEYIIIGEVREKGAAQTLFHAVESGHTTFSTFHAGDVEAAVNRFTNEPLNISPPQFAAMDLMCLQEQFKRDGERQRRGKSITEIVEYDNDKGKVEYNEVFTWDSETDEFKRSDGESAVLEQVRLKNGWSEDELWDEYARREIVLAALISEPIQEYRKVAAVLQAYMRSPNAILKLIADGELAERVDNLSGIDSLNFEITKEEEERLDRPVSAEAVKQAEETLNEHSDILNSLSDTDADIFVDIDSGDDITESLINPNTTEVPVDKGAEDSPGEARAGESPLFDEDEGRVEQSNGHGFPEDVDTPPESGPGKSPTAQANGNRQDAPGQSTHSDSSPPPAEQAPSNEQPGGGNPQSEASAEGGSGDGFFDDTATTADAQSEQPSETDGELFSDTPETVTTDGHDDNSVADNNGLSSHDSVDEGGQERAASSVDGDGYQSPVTPQSESPNSESDTRADTPRETHEGNGTADSPNSQKESMESPPSDIEEINDPDDLFGDGNSIGEASIDEDHDPYSPTGNGSGVGGPPSSGEGESIHQNRETADTTEDPFEQETETADRTTDRAFGEASDENQPQKDAGTSQNSGEKSVTEPAFGEQNEVAEQRNDRSRSEQDETEEGSSPTGEGAIGEVDDANVEEEETTTTSNGSPSSDGQDAAGADGSTDAPPYVTPESFTAPGEHDTNGGGKEGRAEQTGHQTEAQYSGDGVEEGGGQDEDPVGEIIDDTESPFGNGGEGDVSQEASESRGSEQEVTENKPSSSDGASSGSEEPPNANHGGGDAPHESRSPTWSPEETQDEPIQPSDETDSEKNVQTASDTDESEPQVLGEDIQRASTEQSKENLDTDTTDADSSSSESVSPEPTMSQQKPQPETELESEQNSEDQPQSTTTANNGPIEETTESAESAGGTEDQDAPNDTTASAAHHLENVHPPSVVALLSSITHGDSITDKQKEILKQSPRIGEEVYEIELSTDYCTEIEFIDGWGLYMQCSNPVEGSQIMCNGHQ
jgi:flagellar protein FlaI